jgi:serine/threonine-protein kinase RsbW
MAQSPFALDRAIPSDVQYIEGIVAEVAAGCAGFDYPSRVIRLNLPIALTEALANAILRGNGEDSRKFVRIRARVDHVEVVVEVGDEGTGFDMAACCIDPTTPDRLGDENGRGLFLMRRLVDHMEQYIDGGNVVRFTVRRT